MLDPEGLGDAGIERHGCRGRQGGGRDVASRVVGQQPPPGPGIDEHPGAVRISHADDEDVRVALARVLPWVLQAVVANKNPRAALDVPEDGRLSGLVDTDDTADGGYAFVHDDVDVFLGGR